MDSILIQPVKNTSLFPVCLPQFCRKYRGEGNVTSDNALSPIEDKSEVLTSDNALSSLQSKSEEVLTSDNALSSLQSKSEEVLMKDQSPEC